MDSKLNLQNSKNVTQLTGRLATPFKATSEIMISRTQSPGCDPGMKMLPYHRWAAPDPWKDVKETLYHCCSCIAAPQPHMARKQQIGAESWDPRHYRLPDST